MPVNGYTVGRDTTVNMTGPNGTNIILPPDQVTNFDAKPLKREEVSRPLNSPPKFLYMPDGWRLTIEADRQDASLDQYMSDVEQAFWAGANTAALARVDLPAWGEVSENAFVWEFIALPPTSYLAVDPSARCPAREVRRGYDRIP